jgi:uncharacterized protein
MVVLEYDRTKNEANCEKHAISLEQAHLFEWSNAVIITDNRRNYGEQRFSATGYILKRLHVMVFTQRKSVTRIISLRKANKREQQKYAKKT